MVPKISVIIDTYNYGYFVEEAIDSVLSQDFPHEQLEVLVVDDGSTDNTAERVKKYGAPVQYLYKPNGGQASAFNFGFSNAQGEIIAFLDADDTWLPCKLKRVAQQFETNPDVGMVYHPFLKVDMNTGAKQKSECKLVSGSFFENTNAFRDYAAPIPACASFRRTALACVMPIPDALRTQADGYIGALIVFVAPILAIPECLATYRLHNSNLYHLQTEAPPELLRKRSEITEVQIQSIHRWLREHGYGRDVRFESFLGGMTFWHERNKFAMAPPGRFRYFWFLLKENYLCRPMQSRKATLFHYLTTPLALFLGFRRADVIQKWRLRALEVADGLLSCLFEGRWHRARNGG